MINILICDDDRRDAKRLSSLIDNSGFDVNTVVFHSGDDALDYVQSGGAADVCFLDIVMPKMTGVDLAQELRADGFSGDIIFLTNSNEYAAESYTDDAFSYLLKPPDSDSVQSVLHKLDNIRKNSDTSGIPVKTAGIARFILFRDISYIEVIQHKVYFRLTSREEIAMTATFGEIAERLLRDSRFIRCHRSFIVNMSAVATMKSNEIIMRCGAVIPISKSFLHVKKQYLQWIFGGNKNDSLY